MGELLIVRRVGGWVKVRMEEEEVGVSVKGEKKMRNGEVMG